MSMQKIIFGILTILSTLAGFVLPQVRNIETILSDHDQPKKVIESTAQEQ